MQETGLLVSPLAGPANPAYAPTVRTWLLGVGDSVGTNESATGEAEGWFVDLEPFNFRIATGLSYTATVVHGRVANCKTYADEVRFGIWSKSGATYTLVASQALTQPANDTAADIAATLAPAITFAVTTGLTYFWGLMIHAKANATRPSWTRMNANQGPAASARLLVAGATMPTTLSSPTTGLQPLVGSITVTTTVSLVYSNALAWTGAAANAAAGRLLLPKCTSHAYWTKLADVISDAAGVYFSFECNVNTAGNAAQATAERLYMNGGGTGGADFVRHYDGTVYDVVLDTTHERGMTFDLAIYFDPVNSKADLFYCDREHGQGGQSAYDIVWLSHKTQKGGAHGAAYALKAGGPWCLVWLISNGASAGTSLGTIQVGCDPLVIIGDSQAAANDTAINTPARLGTAIPAALADNRMTFGAAISSARVMATSYGTYISTALYLQYKGDLAVTFSGLCDMRNVTFVWAGPGLNDIHQVALSAVTANQCVADVLYRTLEVFYDALVNGNKIYLLGLPPCSMVTDDEFSAAAIRMLNRGYLGLARGLRLPYSNPWWSMATPATRGDAVPGFDPPNALTDHQHYSTAGAAAVAGQLAAEVQGGKVPAWTPN
jgi:hypothetical protein